MKKYGGLVKKAVGASLLIGLGDYVLIKIGLPIGPFLFAFGLLGVCVLKQNLFTGKCGFIFEDKIPMIEISLILLANLVGGYLIGMIFGMADPEIASGASTKVMGWEFSVPFLIKSVMCGVIMYLAVKIYREGSKLGILLGVPLFIFCGFQHCIANVITMGMAWTFDWSIVLAVAGNFVGSIVMWWLSSDFKLSR